MSNPSAPAADIATLPFEAAMKELEAIVAQLEKGEVSLETSIAIYERGELLKKRCESLLHEAETRIDKITMATDGSAKGTAPLDPER